MKRIILGAAFGLVSLVGVSASAQATPIDRLDGMTAAPIEQVQYFFGGRRYCWYPDGWRGPGYYRCGFAWRRGFGWGGPMGWRGWGGPPRYERPMMREHRHRDWR